MSVPRSHLLPVMTPDVVPGAGTASSHSGKVSGRGSQQKGRFPSQTSAVQLLVEREPAATRPPDSWLQKPNIPTAGSLQE